MMRDAGIGGQGWYEVALAMMGGIGRGMAWGRMAAGLMAVFLGGSAVRAVEGVTEPLAMSGGVVALGVRPPGVAGAGGWRLELQAGEREALRLEAPHHFRVTDWRGFDYLVVEAGNAGASPLRLHVSLKRVPEARPPKEREPARFALVMEPGRSVKWRIPLRHLRYTVSGWDWALPEVGRFSGSWVRMGLDEVREIAIGAEPEPPGSGGPVMLRIDDLRLEGAHDWRGWVDAYGQRSDGKWPRKVASEADLLAWDAWEENELASAPAMPGRDEYQAWAAGPALEATGAFRVARHEGRWWLVAPNGRLFYSTGLCCVVTGIRAPLDELNRDAYAWLPPAEGPFALAWGEENRDGKMLPSVSFHVVNWLRKWGEAGGRERAVDRAIRRQRAWGFTTIGPWSDRDVYARARMPYVTFGPNEWFPPVEPMRVPMVTSRIRDVMHPDFEAEARRIAVSSLAPFRDDPFVIGHFAGNELDWNHFMEALLALPAEQPAKAWALGELRRRYASVEALADAWGVAAPEDFETLRWPEEESKLPPAALADAARLRGAFADQWYGVWAKVIREADPRHLVLGSRIHFGDRWPEVLEACARHMDVMSFNHYEHGPSLEMFQRIGARWDRPILIGEYTFNSLDEGLLTAAVPVASQEQRGVGYRYYTEQFAALPHAVGSHYFQYLDEPITGRSDTETAYNGFVNVADVPSLPLVNAAREANARIYDIHAGRREPFGTRPVW